jgi:hypothetical protein
VNGRYVVDENGERVAVLLDIEDYERMVANHRDPDAEDEPLDPRIEVAQHHPTGRILVLAGTYPEASASARKSGVDHQLVEFEFELW